ncbi:class I adenylate-forming enzyme family protein [Brevibacterium linens]|nr:AMP-binding protein [Brevibacterium linens]
MTSAAMYFDRGRSSAPNGLAFVTDDESWTYDEAGRMVNRLANAMAERGIAKDSVVAVLSPNSPTAWFCVLATWRLGATWVPLNPDYPSDDMAELLNRFDVDMLIYSPLLGDRVEELRERNTSVSALSALGEGAADGNLLARAAEQSDEHQAADVDSDDVAVISPTGGTTGLPKGVMITHRNISIMVAHQMLALEYGPHEKQVNLVAAPMTHSAGFVTLQATARGGTVVIIPRATADGVLSAVKKYSVTETFLPPTVIYRLLDKLQSQPRTDYTLRHLIYGAAPMSTEKLRQGIDMLGPVFVEVYGQMEAVAAIALMRPDEHLGENGQPADDYRLSSCGRPCPLIEVTIRDPENLEELATGETGEVCVRGDLVMKGYYKDPEKTAQTIVNGWLRTGDLGHCDQEGYLHITDRLKDLIISGGFNVYPSEVEQAIWGHPAVMDCAVIGVPHDDWGEQVCAFVELNVGAEATEEELRKYCRERLGPVRTPKEFNIEVLPRSANGKVLKKVLRERRILGARR